MTKDFMIGELAKRTGSKVPTIRYYEEIGVMPLAARAANNRRIYNEKHLERLNFICHCRELGFSLDEIRNLLDLSDHPSRSCNEVDYIARNHLKEVEQKIASLSVLKSELNRMISHCEGGTISDCRIIKVLADHTLCEEHGKSAK
ncbi:helix-turn-helix domain-containing protein [Paremcibacter congregatus]|uniref:MerR family transcriptional regulator n=1 Tax=Paremcibacter congregatus TaxID=2043170 RepID=UPI0030EF6F05